jgi:hypothetical protein
VVEHEAGREETAVIVEDWVSFELGGGLSEWGVCGRCLLPSDGCELDQDCGGIEEGRFFKGEVGMRGSLGCLGVLGEGGWVEAHQYNNLISCRQIRV